MRLVDKFGRAITDLRISITDRCNYKCVYCRSGNEGAIDGDFRFADYLRMARVLVELWIAKIRIPGEEPLLRKGVIEFARELSELRAVKQQPLDIAVTTIGEASFVPPSRTMVHIGG
jgi:GTP 3',8-cyclase